MILYREVSASFPADLDRSVGYRLSGNAEPPTIEVNSDGC